MDYQSKICSRGKMLDYIVYAMLGTGNNAILLKIILQISTCNWFVTCAASRLRLQMRQDLSASRVSDCLPQVFWLVKKKVKRYWANLDMSYNWLLEYLILVMIIVLKFIDICCLFATTNKFCRACTARRLWMIRHVFIKTKRWINKFLEVAVSIWVGSNLQLPSLKLDAKPRGHWVSVIFFFLFHNFRLQKQEVAKQV